MSEKNCSKCIHEKVCKYRNTTREAIFSITSGVDLMESLREMYVLMAKNCMHYETRKTL
jgi:hypothetical protein